MPRTLYNLSEHNVLFARCFGQVSPDDVIDWHLDSQITQTSKFGFLTIIDLSEVTGTDMTFDDLNAIHARLVRHYEPRRQKLSIFLYAPDDLTFGMTRILQSMSAMTDHVNVHVFRDCEALKSILPEVGKSLCDLRTSLHEDC